jgi:hypothetical protein
MTVEPTPLMSPAKSYDNPRPGRVNDDCGCNADTMRAPSRHCGHVGRHWGRAADRHRWYNRRGRASSPHVGLAWLLFGARHRFIPNGPRNNLRCRPGIQLTVARSKRTPQFSTRHLATTSHSMMSKTSAGPGAKRGASTNCRAALNDWLTTTLACNFTMRGTPANPAVSRRGFIPRNGSLMLQPLVMPSPWWSVMLRHFPKSEQRGVPR